MPNCLGCVHFRCDEFEVSWCELIENRGEVPWDLDEFGEDGPEECPEYDEYFPEHPDLYWREP